MDEALSVTPALNKLLRALVRGCLGAALPCAALAADPLLATSAHGRACRAAYQYELKHTRVTLRVVPSGAGTR